MTIICKTTLLAAEPPFEGSVFTVRAPEDDPTWGIYSATLAEGFESVRVDWGDGEQQTCAGFSQTTHAYARPGTYAVRVESGLQSLCATNSNAFGAVHAHKLIRFETTDPHLTTLQGNAFCNCVNLASFSIAGSGVVTVGRCAFSRCTGLYGRIDFPGIPSYQTGKFAPLGYCTGGITEIHFDATMAETFGKSEGFLADPTLGTGTARTIFDLP